MNQSLFEKEKGTSKASLAKSSLTPALKQYFKAKEQFPEAILFFQMGDFYELFFEDAQTAAPLLDLTLTSRQKLNDQNVPLCGVPISSGESYINRLVDMGYKVAVCDQISSPRPGAGLAAREVKRVITPGTYLGDEGTTAKNSRRLVSLYGLNDSYALAALDLSTGELICSSFDQIEAVKSQLSSLEPREILISQDSQKELKNLAILFEVPITEAPAENFDRDRAAAVLEEVYAPRGLTNILVDRPILEISCGALIEYCRSLNPGASLSHLNEPRFLMERDFLLLDEAAVRNLELFKNSRDSSLKGSLLGLIDKTKTLMGARLIREWLARPLTSIEKITLRHQAVENLVSDVLLGENLDQALSLMGDLEKALSRLTLGRGSVKDLFTLRASLEAVPKLKQSLETAVSPRLIDIGEKLNSNPSLLKRLKRSLIEEPQVSIKDLSILKSGLSPVLDTLRELQAGGKKELAALETTEKRRSGINNLKIGFNKIFGYYFEVSKSNLASTPKDWTRKQTTVGGERFISSELKLWEEKILTAEEKADSLEAAIIDRLKKSCADKAQELKELAALIAEADVYLSLARCAASRRWVRAQLSRDDLIDIKGGRHPVVEEFLSSGETFVENDVHLSHNERLLIITGPNMAGKSTILRQTALIVILNQMGSFIPAAEAKLSIRDQVFTRVGASDNLAGGQSTFMVEMIETAKILNKATHHSLVVLDEIGRGTSTFDGLAIAWSVAEYLHDLGGRGVPTLFATHYHELVELAKLKPLTRNYNVSVKKWGDSIIFLRSLKPGGVNRSYGLDVASLAGLPPKVIKRAREVLKDLSRSKTMVRVSDSRDNLFTLAAIEQDKPSSLVSEIANLNTEELSPMAALNLLVELKNRAREALS
ncbi:MAG: DNA mismatch repair protein MutS [Deltaproteobacteria bacterium]|nr:DNA mismatch repair protein MutS [Deltaproteobacteria bacterium]